MTREEMMDNEGSAKAREETEPADTLWGEVQTAAETEAAEKTAKEGTREESKSRPKGMETAELIRPVVDMIAGVAPPPVISEAERKLLAQSAGDLVDHLFPGGLEAWGPWYTFALVWGAVFAPRIFAASGKESAEPVATGPVAGTAEPVATGPVAGTANSIYPDDFRNNHG